MLTAAQSRRLTVVLVGARNPGNIGAAARAMQDFGFSDMRFVSDYTAALEAAPLHVDGGIAAEAAKAAVGAARVLAEAGTFTSVADAVADCTLVVGTTAIGDRAIEQPLLPLQQAAERMLEALAAHGEARVALLFGSEKTGLTTEQLSHCGLLLTIPMFAPADARHLSMNLGQSVAVCLYELARAGFDGARTLPAATAAEATAGDRERLTQLLLEVMEATEYSRRFPANSQPHQVRRLAQSAGATHAEAENWMGLLRQVLWSLRKG